MLMKKILPTSLNNGEDSEIKSPHPSVTQTKFRRGLHERDVEAKMKS